MKILDRIALHKLINTLLDFIIKLCNLFLDKEKTETEIPDTKPPRKKLLKRIFDV